VLPRSGNLPRTTLEGRVILPNSPPFPWRKGHCSSDAGALGRVGLTVSLTPMKRDTRRGNVHEKVRGGFGLCPGATVPGAAAGSGRVLFQLRFLFSVRLRVRLPVEL